jgi:hypothetical protein
MTFTQGGRILSTDSGVGKQGVGDLEISLAFPPVPPLFPDVELLSHFKSVCVEVVTPGDCAPSAVEGREVSLVQGSVSPSAKLRLRFETAEVEREI